MALSISVKELEPIVILDAEITDGVRECLLSCYAKLHSNCEVSYKTVAAVLAKIWGLLELVVVRLNVNYFYIFFFRENTLRVVD